MWKPVLMGACKNCRPIGTHSEECTLRWGSQGCIYDPEKDSFPIQSIESNETDKYMFVGERHTCRGESLSSCFCLPEHLEAAKKAYAVLAEEMGRQFQSYYSQPWV